jgi:hypothetical protein
MTSTLDPIALQGSLYINNLKLAYGSATTLTMGVGQAKDSANQFDMFLNTGVTINAAVNGLNGLDTGSLGNNKTYYIYLIADAAGYNVTGALMSLSATAPQLPAGANPSGYSLTRIVGTWLTDGSGNLLKGYYSGNGNLRTFWYDTSVSVLSGGTAQTLTAIDLTTAVPAIDNTPVLINVSYTPATAGDYVSFAPFGSTATVLPNVSSVVAAKAQTGQLKVISKLSTSAKILYINSAASGATTVLVSSYDLYI